MSNSENPFSALVDVIRKEVQKGAGPAWGMGEVVSTSPLKVEYQGVQLTGEQVADAEAWAGALAVGDRVPVLPDREDGKFVLIRPGGAGAGDFAPANHAHGSLASDGKIGTLAGLLIGTGTGGAVEAKTAAQLKAILLDIEHPVGSVWTSKSPTSPATLFGGAWEAIPEGAFLMSGGATRVPGGGLDSGYGGSETHAHAEGSLTAAIGGKAGESYLYWRNQSSPYTSTYRMPLSGILAANASEMTTGSDVYGTTAPGGSLPPWRAYYMWERTA